MCLPCSGAGVIYTSYIVNEDVPLTLLATMRLPIYWDMAKPCFYIFYILERLRLKITMKTYLSALCYDTVHLVTWNSSHLFVARIQGGLAHCLCLPNGQMTGPNGFHLRMARRRLGETSFRGAESDRIVCWATIGPCTRFAQAYDVKVPKWAI